MFTSARIRLTAWYLLIIMFISIIFSVSIYKIICHQFEGLIHEQNDRIRHFQLMPPPPDGDHGNLQLFFSPQDLENQEKQLLYTLSFINLGIFVVAGGAAYFLAGRTLRPIKVMMDDQSRFISDASHELKTPLTSLRAEIEVYLMGKDHSTKTSDALLQSSLEEVISLQTLSENLMKLTKYEKPKHIPFQKVVLLEVIENALKKVVPLARKKQIKIVNNVGEEFIDGNHHELTELFIILLDNAVKYSLDNTTITLSSRKKDHMVQITVVDQGMGIEKKDLPHLFDRFYRADLSRSKQEINGFGLGLSIAKKIVEHHHGSIQVHSELGRGTTFTINLPTLHKKN